MTVEEVVNELDELTMYVEHAFTEEHKCKSFEALQMSIESLEKQIPIELEKQGFFKVCKCGCEMSTFLMHNRANYCPNCGQAIKWE